MIACLYMKKIIVGVIIIVLIILGFSVIQRSPKKAEVLGGEYSLVTYSETNATTTFGTLYVEFAAEASDTLNAWIDFDSDGAFSDTEKVVSDFPFKSQKNWKSGFGVKFPSELPEAPVVKIELANGDTEESALSVTESPRADLLDLDTTTDFENSMKGWGIDIAHAQESVTSAYRPGVSDIGQRIAECAPTAAANSIISLATEHGTALTDLPTPTEIIDELKGEMDWTPANGVLPDDFVEGKTRWAVTHGLPIVTEKVGDQHGLTTLQALLDAMGSEEGAAAELRIKFAQNGKTTGGHMVTVVGVHITGDEVYIDVNDPKTPEGTETYRISGNTIENYPYEGDAILSWGFVQRWQPPTGTALDAMTPEEISGIRSAVGDTEKIKVIVVEGKHIPVSLVHIGQGPECKMGDKEMPHWHAYVGSSAKALDGTVMTDPGGCGYGMAINIPVIDVEIQ